MKDSLKTGVFLMNKEYVIQGHYSKALEQVLAASNLEGTKFTAILASSLNARDLGLVQDYFDMVQSRSLPQKKLDNFNPLSELNYVSVETQKEKNLRCGFTSVEREGQVFVLGVVEDITAETKLKKRLAEEEAKRQEEMRSLFEVIHVSPSVFSDFVTDAGYNFDQVMKLLKDGTVSSADALVRIYQLMHAVKSDAYILGLKSFGDKLHALEGKLKTLRDTENPEGIPLDDMLQLTLDIEKILQEKDKLVSTLDTVRAYQTDVHEKREQDEYVLVESLTRACEKVSADLEKKVRFTVRRMDSGALKNAPRREVKEMLTQIVRNAVYHGIESPEARVAKGKNETGVIELSVQKEGNMLRISLQDDGKGLDFAAIRRKAIERHLLSEADANGPENQGRLLQTIFAPEFSTAESAGAHAGRGIGLNLVQDQVRELGGTIKVQTATDKGTAFVMLIPAR
jgi:two-component system chemotaxis sensor kinase CheA